MSLPTAWSRLCASLHNIYSYPWQHIELRNIIGAIKLYTVLLRMGIGVKTNFSHIIVHIRQVYFRDKCFHIMCGESALNLEEFPSRKDVIKWGWISYLCFAGDIKQSVQYRTNNMRQYHLHMHLFYTFLRY